MRLRREYSALILSLFVLASSINAFATDYTWTGGGANEYWNTAANWSGGVPSSSSTSVLIFSTNTGNRDPYNNIANPFNLFQLKFNGGLPAIHLKGSSLAFSTTAQSGIYQYSANDAIIDNSLSWAGTGTLTFKSTGTGGLNLTNALTANGTGGTVHLQTAAGTINLTGGLNATAANQIVKLEAGSVLLSGNGSINMSGSNESLYVGYNGPAYLTIQDNATVSVNGSLSVNKNDTRVGDTSILTLKSGTLSVVGTTIVGNSSSRGSLDDFSAKFLQTGGTANLSGALSLGGIGSSNNLYDINGGTLNANAGISVGGLSTGGQGIGTMDISGNALVSIKNTGGSLGLVIGRDAADSQFSNRTSYGMVKLTGGTLKLGDGSVLDLKLGVSKGIGTFYRSGGTIGTGNAGVTGNLAVDGTGTLILDGTSTNVSTAFGGTLTRNSGTLVIVPYTGSFGTNEKVVFTTAPATANGILGPWAVVQINGTTNTSGDYLRNTGTGLYTLDRATYTALSGTTTTSTVASVSSNTNLTGTWNAYVVKFAPATTTTLGINTLNIAAGGMILNGAQVLDGALSLGGAPTVFAGTNAESKISSAISTTGGLMKFGPGKLILSGDNSALAGEIAVCSGTLNVQNANGFGGTGNKATVATGATLEIQGGTPTGIVIGNVPITINGTGVSGVGALRNMQNRNTLGGTVTLASASEIAVDGGFLTLSGSIAGSYPLTKTGLGTLMIPTWNSFSGTITVAEGTLEIDDGSALGSSQPANNTTVVTGATLAVQNNITSAEPLVVSGSGVDDLGVVRNLQGTNTLSGSLTLAGDSRMNIDAGSLALSGTISGAYSLTKAGPGTLELSGTGSSYSGTLALLEGTLKIASVNNVGSAGVFGTATAPMVLGSSGKTPILQYTGGSASSNRGITLAADSTVNYQVDSSSTTLTLSGTIGGSGRLLKSGDGVLSLSGTSNFSGTAIVADGTLQIASGGSIGTSGVLVGSGATLKLLTGVNQIADTTNLMLGGGTLDFSGTGTTVENVGALVLSPGLSTITRGNTSGYLCFSGTPIVRGPGGLVNFYNTGSSIRFQNNSPLTNGILGGFAFYNNADFATLSGSGPYTVSAYTGYTSGNLGALTSDPTLNVKPTGTQTAISTKQFNSLNLTGSVNSLTINAGNTLTLSSGGLIVNTTSAATISGGTLAGSSSDGLIVNAIQSLTISSTINTSLSKCGAGTLDLTQGYNVPSGTVTITNGTLNVPSIVCSTLIIGSGDVAGGGAAAMAASSSIGSVPEPGSMVLLVSCLFALGCFGLRRFRASR